MGEVKPRVQTANTGICVEHVLGESCVLQRVAANDPGALPHEILSCQDPMGHCCHREVDKPPSHLVRAFFAKEVCTVSLLSRRNEARAANNLQARGVRTKANGAQVIVSRIPFDTCDLGPIVSTEIATK